MIAKYDIILGIIHIRHDGQVCEYFKAALKVEFGGKGHTQRSTRLIPRFLELSLSTN
jgi:hypothetical protein